MDDYDGDDFEDLNETALQQLENNAIQYTQALKADPSQAPVTGFQPPSSAYDFAFDDEDLDDAVVIDESAKVPHGPVPDDPLPAQHTRIIPGLPGQSPWRGIGYSDGVRPQQQPPGRSSDSILPPPRPPQPTRPPQTPSQSSQRYPSRPAPLASRPIPPQPRPSPSRAPTDDRPGPPQYPSYRPSISSQVTGANSPQEIIAALQARVSALTSELTTARGESSILRSKYDKSQIDHEAQVARLNKLNAEQLAKQQRATEAALAAEKHANTELQFTRQDLRNEVVKGKPRRKEAVTTPKKNRSWGTGDGFDDIDVRPSPKKAQGQKERDPLDPPTAPGQDRTPTKGGKRKRFIFDSPSAALEVDADDIIMAENANIAAATPLVVEKRVIIRRHADSPPFDFLKLALDHVSVGGQPLTFDLFSRYAFPSNPEQSFAAYIFEKLPSLGSSHEPLHLMVDFCELLLDMWNRCIQEKYYIAIYDLAALLSYTLQLNTLYIAPKIVTTLLPLLQITCFLVALPRFNHPTGDLTGHEDPVVQQLVTEIDTTQTLSVLYLAALGCVSPTPGVDIAGNKYPPRHAQIQFWKHVQLEFVLMMLSPKHPENEFLGTLSILCTSVLPDSVGPITNPSLSSIAIPGAGRPDDDSQEFTAQSLIDRLSFYLAEPPAWAPVDSAKEARVRLIVTRTLTYFARSPFGAKQLALSPMAIPRLVTVLSSAIEGLYDQDVPTSMDSGAVAKSLDRAMLERSSTFAERSQRGETISSHTISDVASFQATDDLFQLSEEEHESETESGPVSEARSGLDVELEDDEDEVDFDDEETDAARTDLLCKLISQLTLLLHTLVTDPRTATIAAPQEKLAASPGGGHGYLLTLARLTFAEEYLVLERGIDAETIELAHELLEAAATPEEAEGLSEVFGLHLTQQ